MFLPYLVALFLGLATPANTNNSSNCSCGGTVVINTEGGSDNPGDNNDPGDGTGEDGPGTGGGTGNIPPPKL